MTNISELTKRLLEVWYRQHAQDTYVNRPNEYQIRSIDQLDHPDDGEVYQIEMARDPEECPDTLTIKIDYGMNL